MQKISVIVPAYRCADTIGKTLDSLLGQTYKNVEIIVVNDGSPDNLGKALADYGGKITVINKENGGVSSARNAGLAAASGDYIGFLDSDDYLDSGALERIMEAAREHRADIVRFHRIWEYPDGSSADLMEEPFDSERLVEKEEFPQYIYRRMLSDITYNAVTTCVYRRGIIEDMRFDTSMKTGEDAVFNLEAFTRAQRYLYLPDVEYHYYQTGGGITGSGLKAAEKYRYNIRFSRQLSARLSQWGMDTPKNRATAWARLAAITVKKIRRSLKKSGKSAV